VAKSAVARHKENEKREVFEKDGTITTHRRITMR
jgi:hypothetical protein